MIRLKSPDGSIREIPENTPYKRLPGEVFVKSDNRKGEEWEQDNKMLENIAKHRGVGVGDLVAKLTTVLGIPPCSSCEARKLVLNKLKIVGWKIKWDDVK